MIDTNSEAFKAAMYAFELPGQPRPSASDFFKIREFERARVAAALEAYEAARPKAQTITGLPDTLPDGRKIVGWEWRKAGHGEWWYAGAAFCLLQGPALEARPVAITEPKP